MFLNAYEASVVSNLSISGLYKDPWEVPRIVLTKGRSMQSTRSRCTSCMRTIVVDLAGDDDERFSIGKLGKSLTVVSLSIMDVSSSQSATGWR